MSAYCEAPDCLNPVRRGSFCEAHAKRLQRAKGGRPSSEPLQPRNRSPRRAFLDAVLRYADADAGNDEDYRRATWALEQAGRRYFAGSKGGVGRPLSVDADEVATLFRRLKSVRAVARHLDRSVAVVHRVLLKSPVYRNFRNKAVPRPTPGRT